MNVIIDTCILFDNYRLDTPRFQGLFTYLKKTKSKLYISSLVIKEISKKYKENLESYAKNKAKDERVLFGKYEVVDIDKLNSKYLSDFVKLLTNKNIGIIKSKNHNTGEIFDRALNKVPPFNEKGAGFRDTVIWLDVVDVVKKSNENFCFISSNSNDFGCLEIKNELKTDLGKDIKRFNYYNSIESFLSEFGEQIFFIDHQSINECLKSNLDLLLSKIDIKEISHFDITGIPKNYKLENIDKLSIGSFEIEDFFIYSLKNDIYKIQASIYINLDLDMNLYDEIGLDWSDNISLPGNSNCWADVYLSADKKTKKIRIDIEKSINILYPF